MPKSPSTIDPKRQARRLARKLAELYPDADCALDHRNPFELLVATILSAQCTDKKVNEVTPALFARFPDAEALAHGDLSEIETLIHSTGFFRSKARNLLGMAKTLVEEYKGEVPAEFEALNSLPGVGRKTANVVMGTAFGIASGVVVDTHVKRLSRRLGLSTKNDPDQIARELEGLLLKRDWIVFSHQMILHGRGVCSAARPRCDGCELLKICPRIGVER